MKNLSETEKYYVATLWCLFPVCSWQDELDAYNLQTTNIAILPFEWSMCVLILWLVYLGTNMEGRGKEIEVHGGDEGCAFCPFFSSLLISSYSFTQLNMTLPLLVCNIIKDLHVESESLEYWRLMLFLESYEWLSFVVLLKYFSG